MTTTAVPYYAEQDDVAAATAIQHAWRKHAAQQRANQLWGETLNSLNSKQVQEQPRSHGATDHPQKRWQRGALFVQQLAGRPRPSVGGGAGGGGSDDEDETSAQEAAERPDASVTGGPSLVSRTKHNESLPATQEKSLKLIERWAARGRPEDGGEEGKMMDQSYWLELVDKHHRYGSNLKRYHAEWSNNQGEQNFFYWLDHGEGRQVDLPACPRDRLNEEKVTYLNASQRCNYIVDVQDGRLVWRRDKKYVDTSPYHWTDLGEGRGIGPMDEKEARDARDAATARRGSSDSSSSNSKSEWSKYSSDSDSVAESDAAAHYSTNNSQKPFKFLSGAGMADKLIRKTIKSNTWIYVCNQNYELYIGIKVPGQFQHSSFLYGGRVLSAGLIQVQDGVLRSLSPLSGHYRTGPEQFRTFVHALSQARVNLSRCKFSKSLIVLGVMQKVNDARKDVREKRSSIQANAAKNAEEIKEGIKTLFVGPHSSAPATQAKASK